MGVRRRLRRLKRLAYLGAIVGGGVAFVRFKSRRDAVPTLGPTPTWPPLVVGEEPVAAAGDLAATISDEPVAAVGDLATEDPEPPSAPLRSVVADGPVDAWVASDDGACPVSHPVKANANSGIFHVPGGRFYDRTHAERCYRDATAAAADGYRAAKSS
ncbi:MAG: hypothetical protein ABW122_13595 [Ilumatobacteraceae bacterium]